MPTKPQPVVEVNIRPGPAMTEAWQRLWRRLILKHGKNEEAAEE